MFDFDDSWWLVAVVLVVVLWIMGAVIPVRMVAPRVSLASHYVDMDESPQQDQPPAPHRPGLLLPALTFFLGMGLVALSLTKRVHEPEGGSRWVWMAAAAGVAAFWAIILILLAARLR